MPSPSSTWAPCTDQNDGTGVATFTVNVAWPHAPSPVTLITRTTTDGFDGAISCSLAVPVVPVTFVVGLT
jgi:hypothetical protein